MRAFPSFPGCARVVRCSWGWWSPSSSRRVTNCPPGATGWAGMWGGPCRKWAWQSGGLQVTHSGLAGGSCSVLPGGESKTDTGRVSRSAA